MKHHHSTLTVLALAWFLHSPAAQATIVSSDSLDTAVETRWVQADSSSVQIDTRDYVYLTVHATNGTVNGERQFAPNSTVELTATPALGYLFTEWTGSTNSTANPLSLLLDVDKTLTAVFDPDLDDPDSDDLTNFQELTIHGTNPAKADTDDDGFLDGFEVATGYNPNSATNSPDSQIVIYTAMEVRFGAGLGKTYRIESSFDSKIWTPVETGISGNGGMVTRFYTIQAMPKRFFRAVQE